MKAIYVLIITMLFFNTAVSYAKDGEEGKGTSKADDVIHDALYSAYMLEYKEFRNTLYQQVWDVKKMKMSDSTRSIMKKSYFSIQAKSQKWLSGMMNDLLDKKARKSIEENSAEFDKKYNDQLQAIVSEYKSNFLKEYEKLNSESRIGFEDIPALVKNVFSWFKQLWAVDKDYLREKYEAPLLIKPWSEVTDSDFVE